MIEVQGGTFWMGCSSEQGTDCRSDESPLHSVTVSDFYIGKYEVTQAQWKLIMGTTVRQQRDKADTGWPLRGEGDNYPMYYVSWNEAQEFISRLNAATGKNYRLLTEAEWEYAARGGNKSRGYKYSGNNNLYDVAWFSDNSDSKNHPIGTKSPNELDIYDMSGNVWEWCSDWYGTYPSSVQHDPIGASSGSARVIRGSSWNFSASYCRVAFRNDNSPDIRCNFLGFRLARSSK
jgi:formylglycine-generating enzyme required for sulfatase activity